MPLISFQFSSEIRSELARTAAAVFESICDDCCERTNQTNLLLNYFSILCSTISKQLDDKDEDGDDSSDLLSLADSLKEVKYIAHNYIRKNFDR